MASSTKQLSLLLLITLSTLSHARDSQFFDKVSAAAATNNHAVPDAKQPNFLPENNENSYGLYSRDSSATATVTAVGKPLHDHFPKNYNAEAYMTEAQDSNESPEFTEETSFASKPNNNNNYYYNGGGSSFNSRPQRFNGGSLQPEGMSDTRFMEGGKYFYDVNKDKYSRNKPYAGMREDRTRNEYYNNNLYGKSGNIFESNGDGYQSEDQFEDEVKDFP